MKLLLGIDGGGTGCRAAVADADGRVLGRGSSGSANIFSDLEGALGNVLAAAGAALTDAKLGSDPRGLVAVLGLAGANMAEAATRVAGRLPFARVRIESDALVALKGALGEEDGVTATLGTGSVFGVQRGGLARTIGGWGFLLGDQGGGARIGRALCERALLASDGLVPVTPLLHALLGEMGGAAGLVIFGRRAAPADFAGLVPRILEASAAGDPAAEVTLAEADAAIALAIDRLQAEGRVPVCFLGGLGPIFAARLSGRYAGLIRPARGSALDGALAMAREMA